MARYFHPLLALIASATDRELAKYVEYLKYENKILRARLPKQIHTTTEERNTLLKYGKAVGKAIHQLITIVSPATFTRWLRDDAAEKPIKKKLKGGQRKPKELRELVIHIAAETGFGLTRIVGELRRLGVKKISRQTVRNILKDEGLPTNPDRTSDCWTEFLKRHGETLWASDFFSVKAVTPKGLRDLYVLVFLCLQTREVIVTESTEHPNSAWVCEQTKSFIQQTKSRKAKPAVLIHDRDVKYTARFKKLLETNGLKPSPLPITSPNLNGRCEKFIGTIKLECLSRFIVFGKKHLDHLVASFTDYYNHHRSHSSRIHLPPVGDAPQEVASLAVNDVVIRSHVGGLVKSFKRKAA